MEVIDLSDHIERRRFIDKLNADVDKFCAEEFAEPPRKHLGGSVIGQDCQAKIWGNFRWLKQEIFDGRQQRLFQRGHDEEARFIRWLGGVGFTVWELDPNTNKQFRITGCGGHYGGSLDGIGFREDCGYVLLEFKTHNDKSFKKLAKDLVVLSKSLHFRQMCAYGREYNLKYALYNATNKNDDELHYELIPLDWNLADDLYRKADGIIRSQTQPQKIAQVETYFDCKHCHLSGICFRNEPPAVNCRSCKAAVAADGAAWVCSLRNQIIPEDVIPVGCDSYSRIIN